MGGDSQRGEPAGSSHPEESPLANLIEHREAPWAAQVSKPFYMDLLLYKPHSAIVVTYGAGQSWCREASRISAESVESPQVSIQDQEAQLPGLTPTLTPPSTSFSFSGRTISLLT